ncbi:hypothetical protein ACJ73_00063 [Blastomyces percursus]|uniref:Uncharacterized protein n=1 Tax=Blastomyces percursus TaxID=1658174 RepID=A0A1J9QJ85_9EURO|nr:hypothetical protein ACJ73_00063 [Blastomyces percursus]
MSTNFNDVHTRNIRRLQKEEKERRAVAAAAAEEGQVFKKPRSIAPSSDEEEPMSGNVNDFVVPKPSDTSSARDPINRIGFENLNIEDRRSPPAGGAATAAAQGQSRKRPAAVAEHSLSDTLQSQPAVTQQKGVLTPKHPLSPLSDNTFDTGNIRGGSEQALFDPNKETPTFFSSINHPQRRDSGEKPAL